MIKGPIVVTVEGPQGSGKSTLIKILEEALNNAGYDSFIVYEAMEEDLKKGGYIVDAPPIAIYERQRN